MEKNNRKTILYLMMIVVFMGSASFLSVPFYNWFCKVTGYGGTTSYAEYESEVILNRQINVRFDVSLERGLAWEVVPAQRELQINLGQTGLAFYEAFNPTNKPNYFNKIECFCFTEQVLQPGERINMPVTFYVDPEMIENIESKNINSVTLSYTFYEIDLPEATTSINQKTKDKIVM